MTTEVVHGFFPKEDKSELWGSGAISSQEKAPTS